MPSLQPQSPATETLTAVVVGTETLTLGSVGTEEIAVLGTDMYGFQFLLPGPTTYPSATSYPGIYGDEIGLRLTQVAEGGETLTVLATA